jgi:hypothetical protein
MNDGGNSNRSELMPDNPDADDFRSDPALLRTSPNRRENCQRMECRSKVSSSAIASRVTARQSAV